MQKRSPLSGIIILDLTRVLAGPYCTMVLSDLGARVIKVENPTTGDDAREIGPFIKNKSAYFMSLNHGKESIALDLKKKEDRNTFEKLLRISDVLVENFKPQTLKKLNYGWKDLHKKYPKLIYATISGFGHSGPYRNRPSYDLIAQAMGGIMSLTGHPKNPPARAGASIGDIAAGLFAAIGICSALYKRKGKKSGVHIDIGMMDCQLALLENAISRYSATLQIPDPIGARHPAITPFDAFKSKDLLDIKAWQYDIVCNGVELSSGAIRNHIPEIMYKAFEVAGYSKKDVDSQFAGLINAFKYGAPPHGGCSNPPRIRDLCPRTHQLAWCALHSLLRGPVY